jgi:hypothetical protein
MSRAAADSECPRLTRTHLTFRPCSLDAAPLEEVSTWTEQYRPVWEARFDRMDTYLRHLKQQRRTDGDDE